MSSEVYVISCRTLSPVERAARRTMVDYLGRDEPRRSSPACRFMIIGLVRSPGRNSLSFEKTSCAAVYGLIVLTLSG